MAALYQAAALERIARQILEGAGVPHAPASAVAAGLLQADLYGHRTHGLQLLGDYVEAIEDGSMARDGAPQLLHSHGAVETWDGRRLPGVWTTALAVDRAAALAEQFGLGAVALRRSHHIACLAAFLEEPARRGTLILIFSSDPSARMVAPHGGTAPLTTPNPIAAGIPADPDPILIDVSMSITTGGLTGLHKAEGRAMPGQWLLTPDGKASDDPRVLGEGGALLPIGGLDHGHKGFALGLLVECLTQGLSGHRAGRRADGMGCIGAGAGGGAGALRRRCSVPPPGRMADRRLPSIAGARSRAAGAHSGRGGARAGPPGTPQRRAAGAGHRHQHAAAGGTLWGQGGGGSRQ